MTSLTELQIEQIALSVVGDATFPHIIITDREMRDAANYDYRGTIEIGGETFFWSAVDGDMQGFEVMHFGETEAKPRPVMAKRFVPKKHSRVAEAVFPEWQKREWFIEKQRAMNYDLMFSPTDKVKRHYEDWADSKGLVIETVCVGG